MNHHDTKVRLHALRDAMDLIIDKVEHLRDEATDLIEDLSPETDPDVISIGELSARALTRQPTPLSRDVDPRKIGYTIETFNAQFPAVKYTVVLESFWNFYIANGAVSRNWFEKFLSYAQGAQDRATVDGTPTDSIGLPLDPKLRREFLGK